MNVEIGSIFPTSWRDKIQSHLNRDKFACTICDKTFLYKLSLKRHMTKQAEPVKCDKYDKSFSMEDYCKAVVSVLKVGYMELNTAFVYDNVKEFGGHLNYPPVGMGMDRPKLEVENNKEVVTMNWRLDTKHDAYKEMIKYVGKANSALVS